MATDMEPVIGNWYFDADLERSFEVSNVDEDDALIQLRYEDGDVQELQLDDWYGMNLEPGAPSEAWREEIPDESEPRREEPLSDEQYRRAMDWGERSPDDFDETRGLGDRPN